MQQPLSSNGRYKSLFIVGFSFGITYRTLIVIVKFLQNFYVNDFRWLFRIYSKYIITVCYFNSLSDRKFNYCNQFDIDYVRLARIGWYLLPN